MLLKIGGGNPAHGATEGIHFHMFLDAQISYVARDEKRSVIPYVECKYPDGRVEVFRSTDEPLSDAEISRAKKHIVDCIECHNRPSHIYHNPAQSVNLALSQGWISPTLPEVKRLLVETLEKPYKSERDAVASIDRSIRGFYQASYPAVASARGTDVAKAVKQAQTIYTRNYFPEMRVNWKTHPDHMGHMYSPGCFRCHDGKHKSDSGKVLSRDCQSCHTIVSQSVGGGRAETSMKGVPFRHPVDIGDAWKETNCSDCHAPTE
jgi:hypothetical protein